jgi:heme/copper-type cytochrome/quinol oxidase subunit 2
MELVLSKGDPGIEEASFRAELTVTLAHPKRFSPGGRWGPQEANEVLIIIIINIVINAIVIIIVIINITLCLCRYLRHHQNNHDNTIV